MIEKLLDFVSRSAPLQDKGMLLPSQSTAWKSRAAHLPDININLK